MEPISPVDSESNSGVQRFAATGQTLPRPRLHRRTIIDGASSESLEHTLPAHHSEPRKQHTPVIQGDSQSSHERGRPFTNGNRGRKTNRTLTPEVQDYINEAYMDSVYGDFVSGHRTRQYVSAWPPHKRSTPGQPPDCPQAGKDAETTLCQILEPLEEYFAQPQSTDVAKLVERWMNGRPTRSKRQKCHGTGAIYRNNPDAALELNVHSLLNRVRLAFQQDRLDLAEALARKAVGLAAKLEYGPITAKCWYWQGVIADRQEEKEAAAEAFLLALPCVGKYAEGESVHKYVEAYEELILDLLQRQCPGPFDRDRCSANLRDTAQGYTFGLLPDLTSFSAETTASRTARQSTPATPLLQRPQPDLPHKADIGRSGRNVLGLGISIPAGVKHSPVLDRRTRSPPRRASKRSASLMGAREDLQFTPKSSGFPPSEHPSVLSTPWRKNWHRADYTRSEHLNALPRPLRKRRRRLRKGIHSPGKRDFRPEFSDVPATKNLEEDMSKLRLHAWNLPSIPMSQKQSPVPARPSQISQLTTPSNPPGADTTPSSVSKPIPVQAENNGVELFDRPMSTGSTAEPGTGAQHSPLTRTGFFGGWKPLKTPSTWEGGWESRLDERLKEMGAPSPDPYHARPLSIHVDFKNPFSPNAISSRSRPSTSSSNISPFSSLPPRSGASEKSALRKSSGPTPLHTDIKRVSFSTPHAGQRTRSSSISEPSSPSPLRESSTVDDRESESSQEQLSLPPFSPRSPPKPPKNSLPAPTPPPKTSPSPPQTSPPSKAPPSQVSSNWRSAAASTRPRRPSRVPIASSGRSSAPAHVARGVLGSPPLPMPAPPKPKPSPVLKQAPAGKDSKGGASMPSVDRSRESSQSEAEKRALKPSPLRRKGPAGKARTGGQ